MKKISQKILWTIGGIGLLICTVLFWSFILNTIGGSLCSTQIIDSATSPDGSQKAVVFTVDCGATTDWTTHASVVASYKVISDKDRGNALRIDSNHGQAWPLAIKGWPLIKPIWKDPNSLELHYSKNSSAFKMSSKVGEISVQYLEMTPEFVSEQNIETR